MRIPLPKLRELAEAVKALVVGPYTSKFPKVMPEIPDGFRGAPEYHEKDCVGCKACAEVCPARAIEWNDDARAAKRRFVLRYDLCIFCGTCERNCITKKGILLSKKWALVTTNRAELRTSIEKDLVLCEDCGEVVGPRDHILWVAERLGPLAFANPGLMLAKLRSLGLDEPVPAPKGRPLVRGDRIRILCPRCRQTLALDA
jgi:hydrogenase-4 component H